MRVAERQRQDSYMLHRAEERVLDVPPYERQVRPPACRRHVSQPEELRSVKARASALIAKPWLVDSAIFAQSTSGQKNGIVKIVQQA